LLRLKDLLGDGDKPTPKPTPTLLKVHSKKIQLIELKN
jgi:hypothetical protein